MTNDAASTSGQVHVVLTDADGKVTHDETFSNIITQVGNQVYADRGANVGTPPAAPTGMALGTGSTAAATSGAGAALVTGLAGSAAAFTSGATGGAGTGTARRITYTQTWAAGSATASGIAEVVIQNGTATTVPSNTVVTNIVSRAVLGTVVNKGASDSLTITWTHDIGS